MPVVTAPVELYRDPEIFEQERARIFARSWQFFGIEADLRRPGDYLADAIAGYPIVVVKDEQGVLRGYHNVCRHRAGPLVGEAKGRCDGGFVCLFHAWRYGFDGALRQATGFKAGELDPGDFRLLPVRVETWRSFIFVNLDLDAVPLIETMRPLDDRLGRLPHLAARIVDEHPVACNWKVYVENHLDGYRREGGHSSARTEGNTPRYRVQMQGAVALYDAAEGDVAPGLRAWVWPNFAFSLDRGVLLLETIRPTSCDRTEVQHLFLHEPEDPSGDAAILNAEHITEEDAWMCEQVQQNLRAGIYRSGVISSEHEAAVAWFQAQVQAVLAG